MRRAGSLRGRWVVAETGRAVRPVLRALRSAGLLNQVLDRLECRGPAVARRWVRARRAELAILDRERQAPLALIERAYRQAVGLLVQRHGADALGDHLEFGVFAGVSLACMYRVLADLGVDRARLVGFDSFQGLPPEATEPESGGVWPPGTMAMDERSARRYLRQAGVDLSRVTLVKGWYRDTLNERMARELGLAKASLIMVDCDLYSSTRAALRFCAPLIRDEAIIFFDEWHSHQLAERGLGERRAFEEFLREHPALRADRLGPFHTQGEMFRVYRTEGAG